MRSEFRLTRRWAWGGLVVLGLIGALYGIAWFAADPAKLLEREVARLRAEGFAVSHDEWHWESIPREANVAVELNAADDWLVGEFGSTDSWAPMGPWRTDLSERWWDGATEADEAELDAFLGRAQPYFRLVNAALERPRFLWCCGAAAEGEAPVEPPARLRRLRWMHAALARRAKDLADRVHALAVPLRLLRRIERPYADVAVPICAAVEGALHDLRAECSRPAIAMSALRAALEPELRFSISDRLPDLCRAELSWQSETLTGLVAGRIEAAEFIPPQMLGRTPTDRVVLLLMGGPDDVLRAMAESAQVPASTCAGRLAGYREIDRQASKPGRLGVWPALGLSRRAARLDATLRLARIALAATERRETTGAWPASLDDLRDAFPDGGVPTDPFTDRPFVYEVRGRALRIASAGRCDDEPVVSEAQLTDDGLLWTIER